MLAGHRTARLGEVLFPGFNRGLFWGQCVCLSSRDIRFIASDWFWL